MDENKFKSFLVNGFQALDRRDSEEEEYVEEESFEEEEDDYVDEPEPQQPAGEAVDLVSSLKDLETELIRIRYMIEDMRDSEPAQPDLSAYMTTREQFKSVTAAVEKRNAETANKVLVGAMEAISVMREDFFKLCQGMRGRIDELSADTVLSSFEAYSVDMENILVDGGVYIGAFPYERLNTLHQRIVGVIPTGDAEKDGMIADRLSDGYKFGDKILMKEKVNVYKYDPKLAVEPEETDSETVSETDSETASETPAAENKSETDQEEEE